MCLTKYVIFHLKQIVSLDKDDISKKYYTKRIIRFLEAFRTFAEFPSVEISAKKVL